MTLMQKLITAQPKNDIAAAINELIQWRETGRANLSVFRRIGQEVWGTDDLSVDDLRGLEMALLMYAAKQWARERTEQEEGQ